MKDTENKKTGQELYIAVLLLDIYLVTESQKILAAGTVSQRTDTTRKLR